MAHVVAVTGACGFIGRAVTTALLERGDNVYAVDRLTAPADPSLPGQWAAKYGSRFHFVARDITDLERLPQLDWVINLAAETHVDHSIDGADLFLHSNVLGVAHLLTLCARQSVGFLQVSTDEVYGDVRSGATTEDAPLHPSSPYAATKAASDLLVMAWGRTHGVRWRIVRPSNCWGPGQHPDKFIPRAIRAIRLDRPITVHGDGEQRRSWLHVEDAARAILTVLDRGMDRRVYNIGGEETAIKALAYRMAEAGSRVVYVDNPRSGADERYCVDDTQLRGLGWSRKHRILEELPALVEAEVAQVRW